MDTASCSIGLTAFVIKEISPKIRLVPMFTMIDKPIAPR